MTGWLSRASLKGCWGFSVAFRRLVSGSVWTHHEFVYLYHWRLAPSSPILALAAFLSLQPLTGFLSPFAPLAVAWTVPAFEISRSGNPLIRASRWDYHRGQLWLLPHLPSPPPAPLAIPTVDSNSNQIPFIAGRIRKLAALFHGTKTEQDEI